MNKKEFMKMYKQYKKIEDMPKKELEKIIESSMKVELEPIVPVPYKGKVDEVVKYNYKELVSHCPMTNLLDTYEVTMVFTPDKFIPELKSLKKYFLDYEYIRISHEHITAKIYQDFNNTIKPKKLKIDLSVAVRGGIKTDISYEK